jgi:hypothetical protein
MAGDFDLELKLNDVRDFFVAPEYDPFDTTNLDVSGVDHLVNYLTGRRIRGDGWRLTVYLPAEQITPELPAQMQAAIERYSSRQIERSLNQIRAYRSEGIRIIPLSFALIFIGVAIFAAAYTLGASFLIQVIIAMVVINIFYLAGWWPMELIIFEGLEDRRLANTHRLIIRMPKTYKARG